MDYSKLTTNEVLDTLVKYSQDIVHFEEAKSNHPDVDFSDAIESLEKCPMKFVLRLSHA